MPARAGSPATSIVNLFSPDFTRFFTFLSLFAGAMLGVVIANSLLLLFICWELVGLTSYLLIGFWYHKPSAAAAAKKAFATKKAAPLPEELRSRVSRYERVAPQS